MSEKLLTVKELAAWLDLSVHAVYRRVQNNQIPHIRIGPRTVRFSRSKIQAWLTAMEN